MGAVVVWVLVTLVFGVAPLSAETVSRVDVTGLHEISEELVRDVIGIKAGDSFSLRKVDLAIDRLRKWGAFDTIEVEPSAGEGGVLLSFRLSEGDVVASLDISGNYPYIENKIRKHLTLHPGEILTPKKLGEQIDRIKDFYNREGFVGSDVFVEEERIPEWGGLALTFHIRRGMALRIRRIEITGNHAFPKGRFVSELNPYRQFSERRLADWLRGMKKFYAEHGYPKARIKLISKKIDFDAKRVDIGIEISEGPKVLLEFHGAKRVSRRALRKAVTLFREGSFDQYEMEESARAIKDLLQERGYPEPQVESAKEELPDGTIRILFLMTEGKEQRLRQVRFEEKDGLSHEEISEKMHNRAISSGKLGIFYPEDEAFDNEEIRKAFRKKGYLDADVGPWQVNPSPQGYALDLTIPVDAGVETRIGEISFAGNGGIKTVQLLKTLKARPGEPFDEPGLEEEKKRIITFYGDHGYPYASVEQSFVIDGDAHLAHIKYDIAQGKRVVIGRIVFVGDVMTSQRAIKGAMEIHEGDSFSFRKILDSQLSIRRLGPFAAVNIETIGLENKESVVHLKIRVEEQRPFQVDLGTGYSTDEGITGLLSFTNINAFGWAKSNTLRLIAGEKLSRAEIGWIDHRFLSSSFEMSVFGWVQQKKRPAFNFVQTGGSVGWLRRFHRTSLSFRYEFDRNYFVTGDSVAADAESLRNNTISKVTLSASFDTRDSFTNPRRGYYTLGATEFFNEIGGNHANFVKLTWQGEWDASFLERLTLSTAARFGRIQGIGALVSVPTNELLFMGGDDTVRGFSADSLGPRNAKGEATGGRVRWIINEELRIKIVNALDAALFYDMGSLTNTFSEINARSIRNSVGFGLRYITPVGPIRADYGFKLDREPGESVGRFHLTFGYVF